MKCELCKSTDVKALHWNSACRDDLLGPLAMKNMLGPSPSPHAAMLELGFTVAAWGAKLAFSKVHECQSCKKRWRHWAWK